MFSKILIKVFYLTGPEFADNTVPELFVQIVIVVSKLQSFTLYVATDI